MASLAVIAFTLGVVFYSAASTLFFLELLRPGGASGWGARVLGVAAFCHGAQIVVVSLLTVMCPVESLPFALSFSGLMAVLAYLVLRLRLRIDALGALLAPLTLALLVGAQFVSSPPMTAGGISRPLLVLHIAANVLGVGLFLLAGIAGAFYVVEERRLKKKRIGLKIKLPPLSALDKATHRLLLLGFPLLTFGVVTGSLFLHRIGSMSGPELTRTLLGYLSWLVLGVVLVARRLVGLSARRSAYGTLAGVGCVLLVLLVYAFKVAPG